MGGALGGAIHEPRRADFWFAEREGGPQIGSCVRLHLESSVSSLESARYCAGNLAA